MARVTVEDCVLKVPNRFELVLFSSQRARAIGSGVPLTVERDNDKNSVVSLREISEETVDIKVLKDDLIRSYQKVIEVEEDEDEIIDLMEGEDDWNASETTDLELESAGMHTSDAEAEEAVITSETEEEVI